MKKKISIILVVILCLGLCACGSKGSSIPKDMAESTYNIGIQALNLIDEYLSGNETTAKTQEIISELCDRVQELKPSEEFVGKYYDVAIELTKINITLLNIRLGTEKASSLKENRDNLAELLEKK